MSSRSRLSLQHKSGALSEDWETYAPLKPRLPQLLECLFGHISLQEKEFVERRVFMAFEDVKSRLSSELGEYLLPE